MNDITPCLRFLMNCSLESLEGFELRRLGDSADLFRRIIGLAEELVRTHSEAVLARSIIDSRAILTVHRQPAALPALPHRRIRLLPRHPRLHIPSHLVPPRPIVRTLDDAFRVVLRLHPAPLAAPRLTVLHASNSV
jgi:hypothetical protein